jgi:hypothetical protein
MVRRCRQRRAETVGRQVGRKFGRGRLLLSRMGRVGLDGRHLLYLRAQGQSLSFRKFGTPQALFGILLPDLICNADNDDEPLLAMNSGDLNYESVNLDAYQKDGCSCTNCLAKTC